MEELWKRTLQRRSQEVLSQIVVDLGGDISEAENIIVRRACTIAVWYEQNEAAMANGKDINISEFTTATNALRRLLQDIGLERRAHNITPTLSRYFLVPAPDTDQSRKRRRRTRHNDGYRPHQASW